MSNQHMSNQQPRVIVIAGPPASGKGTQCKKLAMDLGMLHLSTGDFFREQAEAGTELGLQAKQYLDAGTFVPDEMAINLVRQRLRRPDCAEGLLLDGFPRTAAQAAALAQEIDVSCFVLLHVPDQALISRAAQRRIDPVTGDIYHMRFHPPPEDVLPRLIKRPYDDDERAFRVRLETHRGLLRRVTPFFEGKVLEVDGLCPADEVNTDIARALACAADVPPASTPPKQPTGEPLCAICLSAPADHLVVPCGHQCGCGSCLATVAATCRRCPICRSTLSAVQRVYRSGAEDGGGAAAATRPLAAGSAAELAVPPEIGELLERSHLGERAPAAPVAYDEWPEEEAEAGAAAEEEEQTEGGEAAGGGGDAGVGLEVAPATSVGVEGGVADVVVQVRMPDDASARRGVDLCCVVDVSGSMDAKATYEAEDGTTTHDGLSILDVVKHAVKTVAHTLGPLDRLGLVVFSHEARTALPLTRMSDTGRARYVEALEAQRAGGGTNLYAGVLHGLNALRDADADADADATPPGGGRAKTLLLLTDGQPNRAPPNGHVAELRSYYDSHPQLQVQLNTFGFGYSLDSGLLAELAEAGDGTFAFIPDALIVGTTFVNSVANVLATCSQSATLHLMPRGGAAFAGAVGAHRAADESWGRVVSLGPLQWGQPRAVAVPLAIPAAAAEAAAPSAPYLEAVLEYCTADGHARRVQAVGVARVSSADAALGALRSEAVTAGAEAVRLALGGKGQAAQARVRAAAQLLETELAQRLESSELAALHADVSGRASKALQGQARFNRWGKHYLRALTRSHQLQLCTNFMDPGLQHYGGTLFRALRATGDAVFLQLPPPTAAPRAAPASRPSTAPAPDMRTYYAGAGGGCFGRTATVLVGGGASGAVRTPVAHVRAGMAVRGAGGGVARVRCVARIARAAEAPLVCLGGGLALTPRHPVRVGGVWCRPAELTDARADHNGAVFNFVLEGGHVLLVDGIESVTWGHGLQGDVVGHPFYGTSRIVDSLTAMPGWAQGHVEVAGCYRDASGAVVGLRGA